MAKLTVDGIGVEGHRVDLGRRADGGDHHPVEGERHHEGRDDQDGVAGDAARQLGRAKRPAAGAAHRATSPALPSRLESAVQTMIMRKSTIEAAAENPKRS